MAIPVPMPVWMFIASFVLSALYFVGAIGLRIVSAESFLGSRAYLDLIAPALVSAAVYFFVARKQSISPIEHAWALVFIVALAPYLAFWASIGGYIMVVGNAP
jgi:hypothetical protein